MKYIILIITLVLSQKGMAFVTLGSDPQCDFDASETTIQSLIDDFQTEIRMTTQQAFKENLIISKSIDLKGGFDNCQKATSGRPGNDLTVIDGEHLNTVIKIGGSPEYTLVQIKNIKIKNGLANSSFSAGGGINVLDFNSGYEFDIELSDVIVSNNKGINGGGVYLKGDNINFEMYRTLILNNEALGSSGGSANGGGIYCDQATVFVGQGSGVSANSAYGSVVNSGHGGAVYATNECMFTAAHGVSEGSEISYQGFVQNSASAHGGAIYADSGSYVHIKSDVSQVNFVENYADSNFDEHGDGGAIYAEGIDVDVVVKGVRIDGNSAVNGGAFAISNSAILHISDDGKCWSKRKCHVIKNNRTSKNNGKGGAFYLDDASAYLSTMHVSGHRADHGSVIYGSSQSNVEITRSFVFDNGKLGSEGWQDDFTYRFVGDSTFSMKQVTSVKNQSVQATIGQSSGFNVIKNSIFHEPMTNQIGNFINTTIDQSCLLIDNEYGLQNHTNSIVGTPYFVDEANFDLHLRAGSKGIDMCVGSAEKDIDSEAGSWDDPAVDNILGTGDAGADESYAGDVIFKAGFKPVGQ